jgi:hypothetical protein
MQRCVVRGNSGCVIQTHPAEEHAAEIEGNEHQEQEHWQKERELDEALAATPVPFAREEACGGRAH